MKLSKRDIVLLTIAVLFGGQGAAQAILSLSKQYIKKYLKDKYPHDFDAENFRNILSRLKRDKLVEKAGYGFWKTTKKGENQANFLHKYYKYEEFKNKNRDKRPNTIITFDVPELNRKKRDYLRLELVAMGYIPVQKSVLLGHSPLPKEFLDYIRDLKLSGYIQIFTVKEFGTLA